MSKNTRKHTERKTDGQTDCHTRTHRHQFFDTLLVNQLLQYVFVTRILRHESLLAHENIDMPARICLVNLVTLKRCSSVAVEWHFLNAAELAGVLVYVRLQVMTKKSYDNVCMCACVCVCVCVCVRACVGSRACVFCVSMCLCVYACVCGGGHACFYAVSCCLSALSFCTRAHHSSRV